MRTLALALLLAPIATAQDPLPARVSHVIVPQTRSFRIVRTVQPIKITGVKAHIRLLERTATTTLEISLHNPNRRQTEAVLLLPVPDGAVVHAFAYDGPASEPTARILPKDEARRIYNSIVRRSQDPALLEFAGYNMIRSSVFPVPAGGNQKIRLTYNHLAETDGSRIDYVLPRSESLDVKVPWEILVDIKSKAEIGTIYSPSHELHQKRLDKRHVTLRIKDNEPGPFRVSYLVKRNGVNATLYAYPDPKIGGGYFLLLAGVPAPGVEAKAKPTRIRREVTVVIDRSGSMAGPKMDQVRAAALQVIEGLADGEAFNIIDYATTVERFANKPVRKGKATTLRAREYLAGLTTTGGTNIHDALVEAMRQEATKGMLPIVLFLTDGLATIGNTSEVAIRQAVEKGNPHKRRLFTFGVGADVNVPLLDRVAEITRATATYVLAKEDVEVKVGRVFRKLYGPVLSDPAITTIKGRIRELMPAPLPDLFDGDGLVLLGQYRGPGPLNLRLKGNYLGQAKEFKFDFDLKGATTKNAFVPRLWAARRIAFLIDQIRQAGAGTADRLAEVGETIFSNPRYREIADEILRLSTEFGILTEYTSFLAREGTRLGDWETLFRFTIREIDGKAVANRSGQWAVTQSLNVDALKKQSKVKRRNSYLDAKLGRIEISGVEQVNDLCLFRRGSQWIEGRLISGKRELKADKTVQYGTEAYVAMLDTLIQQGRQGAIARKGDILLEINGKNVLVRNRFEGK